MYEEGKPEIKKSEILKISTTGWINAENGANYLENHFQKYSQDSKEKDEKIVSLPIELILAWAT
jgi:hypothetical protein